MWRRCQGCILTLAGRPALARWIPWGLQQGGRASGVKQGQQQEVVVRHLIRNARCLRLLAQRIWWTWAALLSAQPAAAAVPREQRGS